MRNSKQFVVSYRIVDVCHLITAIRLYYFFFGKYLLRDILQASDQFCGIEVCFKCDHVFRVYITHIETKFVFFLFISGRIVRRWFYRLVFILCGIVYLILCRFYCAVKQFEYSRTWNSCICGDAAGAAWCCLIRTIVDFILFILLFLIHTHTEFFFLCSLYIFFYSSFASFSSFISVVHCVIR